MIVLQTKYDLLQLWILCEPQENSLSHCSYSPCILYYGSLCYLKKKKKVTFKHLNLEFIEPLHGIKNKCTDSMEF